MNQPEHPTLLRRPNTDSTLPRLEEVLPDFPEDYTVLQVGPVWTVTRVGSEKVVYNGAGPVEVIRSPAPF